MDERLKREGIKSHKQRVEEYNKYLSNLSEHHDMYVQKTILSSGVMMLTNSAGLVSDLANTCHPGELGVIIVCFVFILFLLAFLVCGRYMCCVVGQIFVCASSMCV